MMTAESYLGSGNSPDFVVVWSHEHIRNALTHHSDNPLIEVGGLCVGGCCMQSCVNHTIDSLDLVLLIQHRNVVLEWVWDPETLVAHI